MMNIGSNIKRLRRQREMTQEALAEYLGVSVSAVSQWESEKTSPDLSLIPPLCNLLDVTSDELFGINLEQKEKRIEDIRKEASSYYTRGYSDKGIRILKEGLQEFPNSYGIMNDLMHNIFRLMYEASDKEEEKAFADEIIRLGEKILEKCVDDSHRQSAIQLLCMVYAKIGNQDRAVELANQMPYMVISREFLYPRIYNGSEGYKHDKRLISDLIGHLANDMEANGRKRENGEFFYTEEERAALREKNIAFFALMFENQDYGFYHCRLASTHEVQARYYARKADAAQTLAHLAKAAEHAIEFVKYSKEERFTYTSLILRGYEAVTNCFSTSNSDNDALELLKCMNAPQYDFVRDSEEFVELVAQLKRYAAKWHPAE